MIKPNYLITMAILVLINIVSTSHAQTLEPRAYANAPAATMTHSASSGSIAGVADCKTDYMSFSGH